MTFTTPTCVWGTGDICDNEIWSRNLCAKHYKSAERSGDLVLYPSNTFLKNPEESIRWALDQFPSLVAELAIEYGYTLNQMDITKGKYV